MAIQWWGFFSVPDLLWREASVYNGHLRGPVTLTLNAERLAVEPALPVVKTKVCRGWDSNTQPSACVANALNQFAIAAARVLVDDHYKRMPVSQYRCVTLKNFHCSLAISFEYRPIAVKVTSSFEWKMFVRDQKIKPKKGFVKQNTTSTLELTWHLPLEVLVLSFKVQIVICMFL